MTHEYGHVNHFNGQSLRVKSIFYFIFDHVKLFSIHVSRDLDWSDQNGQMKFRDVIFKILDGK